MTDGALQATSPSHPEFPTYRVLGSNAPPERAAGDCLELPAAPLRLPVEPTGRRGMLWAVAAGRGRGSLRFGGLNHAPEQEGEIAVGVEPAKTAAERT